jgi:hypothetical protein
MYESAMFGATLLFNPSKSTGNVDNWSFGQVYALV